MKSVVAILSLLRPKQWIKNFFVLAPLVFSGVFTDAAAVGHALFAMLLFCVASSASYIVNDIHDVQRDRRHPKKCKTRPLAAGAISIFAALMVLAFLYALLF